jgi:hypothetical protein
MKHPKGAYGFHIKNLSSHCLGITNGRCFYIVISASYGMVFIPSFMMTGSHIQVMFRLSLQQYDRLQYDVQMVSGGTI